MSTKRKFHIPTEAEDAQITRGAEADPDNPPLTGAELARMQRADGALVPIDPDVWAAFKATGAGWQARVNDVLRAYAKRHHLLNGHT